MNAPSPKCRATHHSPVGALALLVSLALIASAHADVDDVVLEAMQGREVSIATASGTLQGMLLSHTATEVVLVLPDGEVTTLYRRDLEGVSVARPASPAEPPAPSAEQAGTPAPPREHAKQDSQRARPVHVGLGVTPLVDESDRSSLAYKSKLSPSALLWWRGHDIDAQVRVAQYAMTNTDHDDGLSWEFSTVTPELRLAYEPWGRMRVGAAAYLLRDRIRYSREDEALDENTESTFYLGSYLGGALPLELPVELWVMADYLHPVAFFYECDEHCENAYYRDWKPRYARLWLETYWGHGLVWVSADLGLRYRIPGPSYVEEASEETLAAYERLHLHALLELGLRF